MIHDEFIRVPSVATIMTNINTDFHHVLLYLFTLFIIIYVYKEIYSKSSHRNRNIRKYHSVHRKLLNFNGNTVLSPTTQTSA